MAVKTESKCSCGGSIIAEVSYGDEDGDEGFYIERLQCERCNKIFTYPPDRPMQQLCEEVSALLIQGSLKSMSELALQIEGGFSPNNPEEEMEAQ